MLSEMCGQEVRRYSEFCMKPKDHKGPCGFPPSVDADVAWKMSPQYRGTMPQVRKAGFLAGFAAGVTAGATQAAEAIESHPAHVVNTGLREAARMARARATLRTPAPNSEGGLPMTAPDLDPTGAFVRWLVEVVHYPFDYLFNSPPPVDHALIAAHWKAYDDWDCTIEEAREIIRQETGV